MGEGAGARGAGGGAWAGAAGGLVSRAATHPADTLKARLQVAGALGPRGQAWRGLLAAVTRTARQEGLAGFYRGLGAVLVLSTPGTMTYYGGYEAARRAVPEGTWGRDAIVGGLAQVVAGAVFTPMDVLKERLQVRALLEGRGGGAREVAAMVAQEGWGVLFRGYWAGNAVWLPWNIVYISCYEEARRRVQAARGGRALSGADVAASAVVSGAAACVVTHPLDVAKTRLQALPPHVLGPHGSSLPGVLREVLQREGLAGLGSGLGTRVAAVAPGVAISWYVYETLKPHLLGGRARQGGEGREVKRGAEYKK